MSKVIPPDNASRIKISSELGKSFFVEAGAGSGKTQGLVERMTSLVVKGDAGVENIAAITFTRKAATELRERFQIRLEQFLAAAGEESVEKQRAEEALARIDRAFLGTIHSFCGKLLRERSVEAGVDPDFREIEEEDNVIYAEDSWNEYLEKESLRGSPEMEKLISLGVDPGHLKGVFLKRTEYSDVKLYKGDVPYPELSGYKKQVKDFIARLARSLPEKEPLPKWDTLQSMADRSRRLIGMGYLNDDKRFIHLARVLSKKPETVIERWEGLSSEDVKALAADFEAFQEDVVFPVIRIWGEYLHKPIMEFIEKAASEYGRWRKEKSLLNFQDLLTLTAGLLRSASEVRSYFKSRVTRILVDEFQDTDPVQAEIIMLLSGTDNSENDWRKIMPMPGSLFVVGDPKQSIYRFRRADIDIYNMVKEMFVEGGGEILSLEANFRSLPPIGDLTNMVFRGILPDEGTKYQAPFASMLTIREEDRGSIPPEEKEASGVNGCTGGIFINPVNKVTGNRENLAAAQDAENIARWIKWGISGGIKLSRKEKEMLSGKDENAEPSDFMILTRAKARLDIYAAALEKYGIPYEISGSESFGRSEELREISALFRCLSEPSDPVPLIAVLRGLFFGVSDTDLYLFKRSGGEFSFLSGTEVSGGPVGNAYKKLREFRKIVLENSPAVAAERIMEETGILPLSASGEMGSTRAGNIIKAMELLRNDAFSEGLSFADLSVRFEAFLVSRSREEMGLFPAGTNAVRVMNLHKAKGLEANVVFLADPIKRDREFEPETHIARSSQEAVGYFAVSRPKSRFSREAEIFAFPPGWEAIAEEEKKYMRAEEKRLEYVAVTRARNILCVSVYMDRKGKKVSPWASIQPEVMDRPAIEPAVVAPLARTQFNITVDDWVKEMDRSSAVIEKAKRKTFEVTSVTREAKKGASFGLSVAGGGKAWGNIVHRALELCGKGGREKLQEMADNWFLEEDLDISKKDELLKLVDGIMKSSMWGRVLGSIEKYFELPFSITDRDTIFSGTMDLVFKEPGGWVVVDYKTDDFEADPARKAAYERQLDMYGDFWEKLTGEKVKEKLLYRAA